MAVIGYARVSTREQNIEAQLSELQSAGAIRVFVDHGASSRIADRTAWVECLDYVREGDTLVIRALDRIAGSEVMAIEQIRMLAHRNIRLRSLTEPFLDVDVSTPMGEAIVGIMAVIAQLRISMIRENTKRGLEHARRHGRVGGRPSVMPPSRINAALELREKGYTLSEIASALGVSKATVSRHISRRKK